MFGSPPAIASANLAGATTREVHRADRWLFQKLSSSSGSIRTIKLDPTTAAHVPSHHEGRPADHVLFHNVNAPLVRRPNPSGELLVKRHQCSASSGLDRVVPP